MKFLKKKVELVKIADQKKKENNDNSKAVAPKVSLVGGTLFSWVYQPALVAISLIALLYVLLEFTFIQSVEQHQADTTKSILVSSVTQSFNAYIYRQELALKSLSNSTFTKSLITTRGDSSEIEAVLAAAFTELNSLYTIPLADVSKLATLHPSISFAGVDLIRRAAAGKVTKTEAFFSDDAWMFQVAVPVKAENNQIIGALMATFDLSAIKPLLRLPSKLSAGKLSLMSNNGTRGKVIISTGEGDSNHEVSLPTSIAQWKISYAPAQLKSIDRTIVWGELVLICLLSAIAILLLCRIKMLAVRNDLLFAADHLKRIMSGENRKIKPFKFGEIHSLVTALANKAKDLNKEFEAKAAVNIVKEPVTESKVDDSDAPLFDDDLLDLDVLSESDAEQDPLALDTDLDGVTDDMVTEVKQLDLDVPQSIFRAYDIRGVVDETLNESIVELLGKAIATEALAQGQKALCVGYDGRLSSVTYCEALTRGIVSTGIDAIVIGQVPTPVLYFSTHHFETGSGVMITGSHNPSNYNGFKMMIGGNTLSGEAIQKLYNRIILQDFDHGQGVRSDQEIERDYLDTILNDIAVAAPLKVVVDAGNGVAGGIAPALIEELGCEVIPLFCEVDGNFPNHHPDPGKPENLQDLIAAVKEHDADVGLAFDGDGDRLGVVTNEGKIIWPDRLLMLFAKDVVSRNPGADIIYDVKCSRRLNGLISSYGGRPIMWKTGHSLMKAKMKETGALLAGEMSGHVFFKERWFGFDDGLYSAARLLEILGVEDQSSDDVFASFPEDVSTPEINVTVTDESKFTIIEKLCLLKGQFTGGNVTTIDGLRVDYPNGWGLCRASNTTPVLVLRFEADDEIALQEIKDKFIAQLQSIDPDLDLNF